MRTLDSKASRTRLAVQQAAIELCLEHGYAAASTRAIAERAGVSERTLFRTFTTKAAIFWHEPLLSRIIRWLEQHRGARPAAALADAVRATATAVEPAAWRLEVGRRKVILSEPDLIATGTQEINLAAERIARLLTPVDAGPDRAFRITLFARFAVAGFGTVPIYSDTTTEEWADALVRVVHLAAGGPLCEGDR